MGCSVLLAPRYRLIFKLTLSLATVAESRDSRVGQWRRGSVHTKYLQRSPSAPSQTNSRVGGSCSLSPLGCYGAIRLGWHNPTMIKFSTSELVGDDMSARTLYRPFFLFFSFSFSFHEGCISSTGCLCILALASFKLCSSTARGLHLRIVTATASRLDQRYI